MISCPVCHQPVDPTVMECRTCNIALLSSPTPQFVAAPGATTGPPTPDLYPASPPTAPQFTAPPTVAPPPPSNRPEWDRPRPAVDRPSPLVVIAAVVVGALLVGVVGWYALGGAGSDSDGTTTRAGATTTPVSIDSRPAAGQTKPLADGWYTYRSPDAAWLVDLPAVPAAPQPLPSNPTILMAYGVTPSGRVGFGWSGGQVAPGTDERTLLIDIMNGIAFTRGATDTKPQVLDAPTGPVVTARMQLSGGSALFVLRSIDRRPVIAMVVAGLGEPDPATATRILDSFRPAG